MTAPAPAHTGPGPMPGTDPREAARIVVGECPDLPFLPELTDRGPGADQTGRTLAMLVDLPVDVSPRGWRLASTRGRLARRAADLLDRDSDALEEAAEAAAGVDDAAADGTRILQVRVMGPWSLSAGVELPGGLPVLRDRGARRDVAASLAEGVAGVASRLAGRLGARSRVVLDEPLLWRVGAGTVPVPSELDPVAAVPADQLTLALCRFSDSLRAGGVDQVLLRPPTSAAPDAPTLYPALAETPRGETPLDGLVLETDLLLAGRSHAALDTAGTVMGDGRILQLEGAPGISRPAATPGEAERAAAALLRLLDTLGAPRYRGLGQLVVTPTVGDVAGGDDKAVRALAGARLVAATAPRVAE